MFKMCRKRGNVAQLDEAIAEQQIANDDLFPNWTGEAREMFV